MTIRSTSSKNENIEIYKLLVEMADRVSQRRQSANSFYLTFNTIIVGGTSLISKDIPITYSAMALSIAGVAISILWVRNIKSYRTLNDAKFRVITDLEKRLDYDAYTKEWELLDPEGNGKRHNPFHKIEVLVPFVFLALYFIYISMHIPWRGIARICGC